MDTEAPKQKPQPYVNHLRIAEPPNADEQKTVSIEQPKALGRRAYLIEELRKIDAGGGLADDDSAKLQEVIDFVPDASEGGPAGLGVEAMYSCRHAEVLSHLAVMMGGDFNTMATATAEEFEQQKKVVSDLMPVLVALRGRSFVASWLAGYGDALGLPDRKDMHNQGYSAGQCAAVSLRAGELVEDWISEAGALGDALLGGEDV